MAIVDVTSSAALGRRVARFITEISSPVVLVMGMLILVGVRTAHQGAGAAWGGVAALLCGLVPMAFIVRGVRAGKWTDHHVDQRDQRAVPLLVATASVTVATVLLILVDAPRDLVALVVAMLVGITLVLLISRFWKISIHTAIAAGTFGILTILFGSWAVFGVVAVLAVAWSRTVLDAHTWLQVGVGAVMGYLVAVTIFPLVR